jgi:hypothetical protein
MLCEFSSSMAVLNPNTIDMHDCLGQQTIAQFHEFTMFCFQKLICKQFLNLQLLVNSLDECWVGIRKEMIIS